MKFLKNCSSWKIGKNLLLAQGLHVMYPQILDFMNSSSSLFYFGATTIYSVYNYYSVFLLCLLFLAFCYWTFDYNFFINISLTGKFTLCELCLLFLIFFFFFTEWLVESFYLWRYWILKIVCCLWLGPVRFLQQLSKASLFHYAL